MTDPLYVACKSPVLNRGVPPDSFLDEIINWASTSPDALFAVNDRHDIYSVIAPILGESTNILYRSAMMLEAMRVHAGFESSWNWNEGVDVSNKHSLTHPEGQETGIFQVSYDSRRLDSSLPTFLDNRGVTDVGLFISQMKSDHTLALDYYARLVRINISWAGPLVSGKILPWLQPKAVDEFHTLIMMKGALG